jgi:hypothetical protein
MRRFRSLRLLTCTLAASVAMIVAMTAAAGDHNDDPAVPGDAWGPRTLVAAVDTTRAVASARVELQTIVAGPSGPVALVHRGEFTDGGVRARAESDMSAVAAALEAAGQQLDGDWSRPTGIVVDGDSVFSQLGPMAEALGRAPDDWARARLSAVAGSASAADNDTLALALDPLGPLDLLRRPVGDIDLVAAEDDVRGTPTRHLRARLDLTANAGGDPGDGAAGRPGDAAAAGDGHGVRTNGATGGNGVNGNGATGTGAEDGATGEGAAAAGGDPGVDAPPGSFEARLVAAGITSLPVDVWLDGDGAVRRLSVTIDGATAVTTTFDVYDIGADIDITPPDPAEVIDPDA